MASTIQIGKVSEQELTITYYRESDMYKPNTRNLMQFPKVCLLVKFLSFLYFYYMYCIKEINSPNTRNLLQSLKMYSVSLRILQDLNLS